jgi:hydrogenase nickel incorporation protein HypB
MCVTCGCGENGDEHVHADGTRHSHPRGLIFAPNRPVPGRDRRTVELEAQILGKNQLIAERNRGRLAGRGVLALNLLSSPGAGKTTLLERTIRELANGRELLVIEGDQATSRDAERIRAAGARAYQVNTGTGCHLDAQMVATALAALEPARGALVLVENVGNLVCPALFDLGERAKVLLASVTEGDDKPLKYPHMFRAAELVLLSKIDLAPYVPFDRGRFAAAVAEVNPRARILQLSALTGEGMPAWYGWLTDRGGAS